MHEKVIKKGTETLLNSMQTSREHKVCGDATLSKCVTSVLKLLASKLFQYASASKFASLI